MIISVHQPQYLPWLGYFDKVDKSDGFVFLDTVQYKPREYQNRNKIRAKNGWLWLSVPVVSKGLGFQRICDVMIDNNFDWQKKHWRSLTGNYGKAGFFKKHSGFFEGVYSRRWDKLMDLNIDIIKYLLKELGIETKLYYESQIGTTAQATARIVEICKKLKATIYLSGTGGKSYLEEEKFKEAGLELRYQNFAHPVYRQRYAAGKDSFLPYMSAIDLLFNEGKNSIKILRGQ